MLSPNEPIRALMLSATEPAEKDKERLVKYLEKKYSTTVKLLWDEDKTITEGFKVVLIPGSGSVRVESVIDWTKEGKLRQLEEKINAIAVSDMNVIPLMKESIVNWTPELLSEEVGSVLTVGDGIANVAGLPNARYGEILIFDGGVRGLVQDLKEDSVGCILFGDDREILQGSRVTRTNRIAGVPVGDAYLGRVVDALGNPIDGKGNIESEDFRAIESPAPGIIDRQPVNKPMETGLLAIDSMFPIGRGQRELIIGDRQTGKTAIALDTIINQKGKDVICIYVAIGQKASSVAQLTENLRKRGALKYTVVVCASASETAPMQYIAPYTGTAIGEYFMSKGKDVLIVYDDLSKHAIAYRALSLLLERSPGREAYPGDVFYLHSRLLERSAHLSDAKGGGSLTALPIVETQAGDVSAYIPTNIISITDGQIFLESNLFNAGQRPAVNVGLSVSRVGGDAQTKAVKKATGALRLDLAQYREMEVFTQFSSDLDDQTRRQLDYGSGLMQLLRQPQYSPFSQEEMVITLVAAMGRVFLSVPVSKVCETRTGLLDYVKGKCADVLETIKKEGTLSDEARQAILDASKEYVSTIS
jgi:F-type H+/Na+-transporting ATPase subunit alpha